MSQDVKRIAKLQSKRATKADNEYDHIVVVRPSDVVVEYIISKKSDSKSRQVSGIRSGAGWVSVPYANWPQEVRNFYERGLFPTPRAKKPTKSTIELRAERAAKQLDRWTRIFKKAHKKVKQYRRKVKYYDRILPNAQFEHLLKSVPQLDI